MITRIAKFFGEIELLWILLTVVVGVGMFGYVGYVWFIYLLNQGRYISLAVIGIFTFVFVAAAFARIPIALIFVLGGAAVSGTALLTGYSYVLLP